MKPLSNKIKMKLLRQIIHDLKSVTGIANATVEHAYEHLTLGRTDDALNTLLEIEPKLYDAKKLFLLSTYVNGLGNYGKGK